MLGCDGRRRRIDSEERDSKKDSKRHLTRSRSRSFHVTQNMSSTKARIILSKEATRQLAKLGMDPTMKDPLHDASIVKWSTVVVPITTKALMENSAIMGLEGKGEAAEIFKPVHFSPNCTKPVHFD